MFPLQRSPSSLAYTYESDEEEDEECFSQLCGCQDNTIDGENEWDCQLCVDETTRLVTPMISRNKMMAVRRIRITDPRLVGAIALALSMLVFCEYYFLVWRMVDDSNTANASITTSAETSLFPVVSSSEHWAYTKSKNTTVQFSNTKYGEVWFIRHGEKGPFLQFGYDHPTEKEQTETLRAMYELSPAGWNRANHLSTLVKEEVWPQFAALFASRPATQREALESYPDFARDSIGQSMVKREYQTLVPISEYLQTIRHSNSSKSKIGSNKKHETKIRSQFAKGEVEAAGLEIAKTAVRSAFSLLETQKTRNGYSNDSGTGQAMGSPIVLVSWDHCSLPTLVVRGFGCHSNSSSTDSKNNQNRCYRCWSDDRFGDVLKLNVSLVTTTTITTVVTNATEPSTKEASIVNTKIEKIVSQDYKVFSTILSMTGEAYAIDQYYKECDDPNIINSNSNSTTAGNTLSTATPMSIEKSTPCTHSYCTTRPAAKRLVRCSCWDE